MKESNIIAFEKRVFSKGSRHFDRLQTANFRHVPVKMTGLMRFIFEYVIYKENSRITGLNCHKIFAIEWFLDFNHKQKRNIQALNILQIFLIRKN